MRILILGGDGYLGWPTAMYFSRRKHTVALMDNLSKRDWERELGIETLIPVEAMDVRLRAWHEQTGETIEFFRGDLCDYGVTESVFEKFRPDALVHYGEQPSAPYSMMDHAKAAFTQVNNIVGTLNVLWAMKRVSPKCHLVKLGTLGEYGTPNIDIEEGFIEISHKGRRDTLPFPRQPGSFYHLSKVHDSHNMMFACKMWKLTATDLNQGIVYGIETEETALDKRLATCFHYDEYFGTVLNRFCVQAVDGIPLTVYGRGTQKRAIINICDTIQCIELTIRNPPQPGQFRVFNQFTETFSIVELASLVQKQAAKMGFNVTIEHLENPRDEAVEHYFNPSHTKLMDLGLKPRYLSDVLLETMLCRIREYAGRINRQIIQPSVSWTKPAQH